jgi:phosphoglycolate phosphatase
VGDLLVLWDVDGTLLNAGGVGGDLYEIVFLQLFGRSLEGFAPMAGRTDRAIILETLELAGIREPRRYVDPFIAGLSAQAPSVRETVAIRGHALPGAAAALAALASARTAATDGRAGRVRQSVLTGNIRPVAEVKLSALGLREALDLCIGAYGDDHEVRAELVHVARRRAEAVHGRLPGDFSGTSTVLVGDTPLDIEAALTAGARAVGVATGGYPAADLMAAGAHAVLPDLTDTGLVMRALFALALVALAPVRPGACSPWHWSPQADPAGGGPAGLSRWLACRRRDDLSELGPPAQSPALARRYPQFPFAGEAALDRANHDPLNFADAAGGFRQVEDRVRHGGTRQHAPRKTRRPGTGGDMDRQARRGLDPAAGRNRHVNQRRPAGGEPVELGGGLVAELRAPPGVEDRGPQSRLAAQRTRECRVHATVNDLPSRIPELGHYLACRQSRA